MARSATRTANVFTRVDPETKEQAEAILNQLGIPMSHAIGMFLKQIVMQRGIPFEMKLPDFLKRKLPQGHYDAAAEYLLINDQTNAYVQEDASGDELLPDFNS